MRRFRGDFWTSESVVSELNVSRLSLARLSESDEFDRDGVGMGLGWVWGNVSGAGSGIVGLAEV